jgi:hypothetical protein
MSEKLTLKNTQYWDFDPDENGGWPFKVDAKVDANAHFEIAETRVTTDEYVRTTFSGVSSKDIPQGMLPDLFETMYVGTGVIVDEALFLRNFRSATVEEARAQHVRVTEQCYAAALEHGGAWGMAEDWLKTPAEGDTLGWIAYQGALGETE